MMFGIDPLYLALALPGMLLAGWAQMKVSSAFRRYSRVPTSRGRTGAEIARRILQVNGISDVVVEPVGGVLTDHYDPTEKRLRLSPEVFGGRSVAAAGIAAHEVGHAIQHAEGYRWLTMRSRMVPVLGVTSRLAMPLILIGFVLMAMGVLGLGSLAMQIGAVLFAVMVVFQLVTLPVEFDASRRALVAIQRHGLVTREEQRGARSMLDAAALTYVAAAISSALTLVYFLMRSGMLGGGDDA